MNKVVLGDSTDMAAHLSDGCVTLIVTSPPQDFAKAHGESLALDECLDFLRRVWSECKRVLCAGGRLCVNVADVSTGPYVPLHSYIEHGLIQDGWLMSGTVIWDKSQSVGSPTAEESQRSPGVADVRAVHEHILVFSKDDLTLPVQRRESDLTPAECEEFTRSVWTFPTESPERVEHAAPFPEELPRRLIKLYSCPGDLVLDPFVGSGTTCVAAKRLRRRWFGIDNNADCVLFAHERIQSTLVE